MVAIDERSKRELGEGASVPLKVEVRPKNWLEPVILASLWEHASYGYELMQRLRQFGPPDLGGVEEHFLAPYQPASTHSSTIRSKKRRKTLTPKRSRMRVRLEWSGKRSKRS